MNNEFLYETHMHMFETCACAVSTAAEQVRAYKERGYTGIITTSHFLNGNCRRPVGKTWKEKMEWFYFGYQQAKKEGEKCGLDVFFGWEYSIRGSDFLTYGLDIDFLIANPSLYNLEIAEYSALVRMHGGYLAQAHPYRDDDYIEYKFPVDPQLIDGIEVYNSGRPSDINAKALVFAKKHNLPMQSGSDSHDCENLRFPSGVKLKKKAENIFDIIEAVKTNTAELVTY